MNEKFKTCDVATDELCAGKDSADMIYQVGKKKIPPLPFVHALYFCKISNQ